MGWRFEACTVGRCFIALCNLAKFVWSCGLYRDCGQPPEPNVTSGPKVIQKYGSNFRIGSRTQVHIQEGGAELDNSCPSLFCLCWSQGLWNIGGQSMSRRFSPRQGRCSISFILAYLSHFEKSRMRKDWKLLTGLPLQCKCPLFSIKTACFGEKDLCLALLALYLVTRCLALILLVLPGIFFVKWAHLIFLCRHHRSTIIKLITKAIKYQSKLKWSLSVPI